MFDLRFNAKTTADVLGFFPFAGMSTRGFQESPPDFLVDSGTPCMVLPIQGSYGACLLMRGDGGLIVCAYAGKDEFEYT